MQKPLTPTRLKHIALFYLERFDASSCKLKQVLKRRVQKQISQGISFPQKPADWIEQIVQELTDLGYLNDSRYTENTVRRLSESGKSQQFIRQKLRQEGIDDVVIDSFLNPTEDVENARRFVRKKRLGQDYKKDMAKLARAGFSYETAKQVLSELNIKEEESFEF